MTFQMPCEEPHRVTSMIPKPTQRIVLCLDLVLTGLKPDLKE